MVRHHRGRNGLRARSRALSVRPAPASAHSAMRTAAGSTLVSIAAALLLLAVGVGAFDVDPNVALEWGRKNGYTIGSIRAETLPGRPRGFVATKDIKVASYSTIRMMSIARP